MQLDWACCRERDWPEAGRGAGTKLSGEDGARPGNDPRPWSREKTGRSGRRQPEGWSPDPSVGQGRGAWPRGGERCGLSMSGSPAVVMGIRRRRERLDLERLEGRELLAFSPLGFSLPDLSVSGFAGPIGAYTGPLAVTVDVANLGASSIIEPLNLAPGSSSTADSLPTTVVVYVSRVQRPGPTQRIALGEFDIPTIPQNSLMRLRHRDPPRADAACPRTWGESVHFLRGGPRSPLAGSRPDQQPDSRGVPVQLFTKLPELDGVALDVPPDLRPGDTIQPNFKIANFGTDSTDVQARSKCWSWLRRTLSSGRAIPCWRASRSTMFRPLSEAPAKRTVLGDANLDNPPNILTISSPQVTLPETAVVLLHRAGHRPQRSDSWNSARWARGPTPGSRRSARSNTDRLILPGTGWARHRSRPPPENLFPIPPFGPLTTPSPIRPTRTPL